jgi:hypothetical protein
MKTHSPNDVYGEGYAVMSESHNENSVQIYNSVYRIYKTLFWFGVINLALHLSGLLLSFSASRLVVFILLFCIVALHYIAGNALLENIALRYYIFRKLETNYVD